MATTKRSSLIEEYGKYPIWINYKLKQRGVDEGKPLFNTDGTPKMTKIPIRSDNGNFASVSEPSSWTTYENAYANAPKFSGVGIVFTGMSGINGEEIVGVDLDHYIGEGKKLTDDRVLDFLIQADTFCSLSQSETGLHFYFVTDRPFSPSMNKKTGALPFEVYSSRDSNGVMKGRYFAESGKVFGEDRALRHVTIEELVELLKILGYEDKVEATVSIVEPTTELLTDDVYVSPFKSDEDLLEAAFRSKTGKKFQEIYNGDAEKWKGDLSSADESLCSSLAFWTGKDKERMRRIWLSAPIAQREKTQKRIDYQESTLDYAIKNCKDVFRADFGKESSEWIMSNGKNVYPLYSGAGGITNIYRLLEKDPNYVGRIRRNEFSHMPEILMSNGKWVDLKESFVREFMVNVSEQYPQFSQVAEATVVSAMMTVADKHPVNPPKDFINSLKWDSTPRLDHWLHHTYHVEDDEIHQQMGAYWMMGLVSRILRPGCKFDYCLCLVSKRQGKNKSQSLDILGQSPDPDVTWRDEHAGGVEGKDFGMIMAKNIIVEFAENAVNNKSDSDTVKGVISKRYDQLRLPYGKTIDTFPRGCVFALTTNTPQFLRDDSGGRRFLIVQFEDAADIVWLKENRDQLLAEAAFRVAKGERYWWNDGEGEALEDLQAAATVGNIYDEKIATWYQALSPERRDEGVLPLDFYDDTFSTGSNAPKEANWSIDVAIKSSFKRYLHLENVPVRMHSKGGKTVERRWKATDKTRASFDLSNKHERGSLAEFEAREIEE